MKYTIRNTAPPTSRMAPTIIPSIFNHLAFLEALSASSSLLAESTYVYVCQVTLKSIYCCNYIYTNNFMSTCLCRQIPNVITKCCGSGCLRSYSTTPCVYTKGTCKLAGIYREPCSHTNYIMKLCNHVHMHKLFTVAIYTYIHIHMHLAHKGQSLVLSLHPCDSCIHSS